MEQTTKIKIMGVTIFALLIIIAFPLNGFNINFASSVGDMPETRCLLFKIPPLEKRMKQREAWVEFEFPNKTEGGLWYIERIQTNMFFFPTICLEEGVKVRIGDFDISSEWGEDEWESPDGMILFHQLHIHKAPPKNELCTGMYVTGSEQMNFYIGRTVNKGDKLYLQFRGYSEQTQGFTVLCYVWVS